ncbi:MAG TPA: hypothetical protein VK327_14535 [Candidatus Paceibacterota bacterium]|nr:hypothetical protein [Candidatus Paceibacterota bacterium]
MKENEIRRVVPVTNWIIVEEPVLIRHAPALNGAITFGSISMKLDIDRKEASARAAQIVTVLMSDSVMVES